MVSGKRHDETLRRETFAMAIRQLRKRLGVSQRELASLIGGRTDSMAVSRWERAKIVPNEWRCKRLVELAKKAQREDMAGVFKLPLHKWHCGEGGYRMTLFHIAVATFRRMGPDNLELPKKLNEVIDDFATQIENYFLDRIGFACFVPELSDGEQYRVWLQLFERSEQRGPFCDLPDGTRYFLKADINKSRHEHEETK